MEKKPLQHSLPPRTVAFVSTTPVDEWRQQRQPPETRTSSSDIPQYPLETAIRRSQSYLLGQQNSEGYWVGELIVDSTLVSDLIAYRHWDGKVDPTWQRKAVNHLWSLQLPDGGWNIYYGGPAEVNATIKAYLALKLAGIPVTDPRMLRARSVALRLGGVPRMNTFSKLYLALLGLYPWTYVPTIPVEVLLIGKWFHVNFWEMSNWSRAMLVPLAIINHFKPTRPLTPSVTLDELYPEGFHERNVTLARDPQFLTWRNFFLALDKLHKFAELWAQAGIHPFRKRALKKAEQWMLERFEGSNGLAAIFPGILNSLIALKALGYPDDNPHVLEVERQLMMHAHETADAFWIEPCLSPVWDTAIAAIALRESGLPADHPQLQHAASWLLDKEIRFRGDWQYKNPTPVEPSGWVFEFENKWNPDIDDTAMVLLALRLIPTPTPQRRDAAFRRGLNWMLTFQCKDGGWAAFDKDCTKNILTKVPFADHNAMLDPECADITARILEVLGREHYPLHHPQIQKALQFLRAQQEPDGSWYGRWGVNYIYGTWQTLRGLHAIQYPMNEPWLLKARDWLESVQQPDGGWGERCDTYEDPVFKGQGPSTASQTAWALMGLCTFGDPHRPSIQRGLDYLIRSQNPDGSWNEDETTGTGFPKVFYLKYDMYRNTFPLLALATFRQLLLQPPHPITAKHPNHSSLHLPNTLPNPAPVTPAP
ncbi:MAG: squalene--hopene cyclase [Verrucomicrobia bacterium]|nr:squalene--hopene cyclase [Verrucomicrobiota bacterium]